MILFLISLTLFAAEKDCNQTSGDQSIARIERVVAQSAETFDTPDTRSYITKPKLRNFTLTPAIVQRLRKTTGKCTCPGIIASCGLAPDGEVIISNAHMYMDEQGQNRKPLSSCQFQNQAVPPDAPVPMVFKDGSYRIGTLHPFVDGEQYNDHAAVRAAHAIPGARPFPINPAGFKIRPGQWVLAVSGTMINLPPGMKQDLSTPIVQECQVTKVQRAANISGYFGSTCRGFRGASGSFNYMLDERGELQLVGIMVSSCADKGIFDKVCDNQNGTRTGNVMAQKFFLKDILEVGKGSRMAQSPDGAKEL